MPLFSSPHPSAPAQRNPLQPSSPNSSRSRRADGRGAFAIDMIRQMRGERVDEVPEEVPKEDRRRRREIKREEREARVGSRGKRRDQEDNINEENEEGSGAYESRAVITQKEEMTEDVKEEEVEEDVLPLSANDVYGFGLTAHRLKYQPASPLPKPRLKRSPPPPPPKTPSLPSLPSTPTSNHSPQPDPFSDDEVMRALLGGKRRRSRPPEVNKEFVVKKERPRRESITRPKSRTAASSSSRPKPRASTSSRSATKPTKKKRKLVRDSDVDSTGRSASPSDDEPASDASSPPPAKKPRLRPKARLVSSSLEPSSDQRMVPKRLPFPSSKPRPVGLFDFKRKTPSSSPGSLIIVGDTSSQSESDIVVGDGSEVEEGNVNEGVVGSQSKEASEEVQVVVEAAEEQEQAVVLDSDDLYS